MGRSNRRTSHGPLPVRSDTRTLTELVRAIETGDDNAWAALITRLQPAVDRALSTYRVDRHLRLDASADTWEILLTSLPKVRDPERLVGWIAVVARNRMNQILKRRDRDRLSGDVDRLGVVEPVSNPDPVVAQEMVEVLHRAVARLSPREQQVLRCRAYTDHPEPLSSMQHRLGIPPGSVGPTLGRGVAKLRRDRDLASFLGTSELGIAV